jgi:predicted TIM-barrel fold metal-dependent hydrolase
MIIDILARIGQHPLLEFNQSPDQILKVMEDYGIDVSFLHPFPKMKVQKDNDMIAKSVDQNPDKFVAFAGINPFEDDALDEVYRNVDRGLKGIMLDPEFHKFMRRGLPKVEAVMVPCLEHNLPVIFNTENIRFKGTEYYYNGLNTLAYKFPEVQMVVNIWWPGVTKLVKKHKNILLCTGGHHNVPGLLPVLEKVGPTRMMMGSETPVMHPAMIIKDIRYKKMHTKYREMILGENAKRHFLHLF